LICPLTAGSVEAMRADMDSAANLGADAVECRLDYLEHPPGRGDLERLLAAAPLDVIVTYRPRREGGRFDGPESQRLAVLKEASRLVPAFVDLEADTPRCDWPAGAVILSHHDSAGVPGDLDALAAKLDASEAAVNKIAFVASGPQDALRALDVLRACGKPTIALAMGEHGVASRILAKKFGAFGTFAALDAESGSAPGQPTIEEFRSLYRWDCLHAGTGVYGVIGCPVAHSMSPAIHNAAFEAVGLDAVYVPLRVEPGYDNFRMFLDAALARSWLDLRGLSVTIPHKENALTYVGSANCDELAVRIGAINTITILPDAKLRGDNTDYAAAIDAMCTAMNIAREGLSGWRVAVLGAGGVSRAIVAALTYYGAAVTVYNRTASRAQRLAKEFSCRAAGLDALGAMDAQIVINCTSVGMRPGVEASPLEKIPQSVRVVFDTIYNPVDTRLLADARAAGCLCVSGLDMFVNQAVAQFEIWTHRPAPRPAMRKVVVDRLAASA
jgi:3-dehydroquinate dehydratase/shikimate dehydrogenase